MVQSFILLQSGNQSAGTIKKHYYAEYNPTAIIPNSGTGGRTFSLIDVRLHDPIVTVGATFEAFQLIVSSGTSSSSGKEEVTVWPLGTKKIVQLTKILLEIA